MNPQHYIKIPITNPEQLIYMQQALLEAIYLLSQVEETNKQSALNSIYWLSQITQESLAKTYKNN